MSDQPTLLVVDDEPANVDLLVGLLRDSYKVKVALNGEKALKVAGKSAPDLVLLDVIMPGMSGLEVCKAFQEDPNLSSVPILLVTGNHSEEDIAEGKAAGAKGVLGKPVDPTQLMESISALLA